MKSRAHKRTRTLGVVHKSICLKKGENTFSCSDRSRRLFHFGTSGRCLHRRSASFSKEVCERTSPRAPSLSPPRSSPWQRLNPDVCTGSSALAPACRVPRCLVSCQRRPTAGQGAGGGGRGGGMTSGPGHVGRVSRQRGGQTGMWQ